jgi:hypothetical protein
LRPPVTEPTAVNNGLIVSIERSPLVEWSHDSRAIAVDSGAPLLEILAVSPAHDGAMHRERLA